MLILIFLFHANTCDLYVTGCSSSLCDVAVCDVASLAYMPQHHAAAFVQHIAAVFRI